jgi:hypothetical protein
LIFKRQVAWVSGQLEGKLAAGFAEAGSRFGEEDR